MKKDNSKSTYILGIETTGAYASVALLTRRSNPGKSAKKGDQPRNPGTGSSGYDEAAFIDVIHGNDRFSHLQNLTPQIKKVLKRNRVSVGDLDAIAVSKGPGSFTGIRIGVSTARALSQVSGVPCVGVSSLEALAMRAAKTAGGALICPILDARRKQVYGGAYSFVGETPEDVKDKVDATNNEAAHPTVPAIKEILAAGSYLISELLEKIEECDLIGKDEHIFFLGDGIDTCGQEIESWAEEKGRSVAFAEDKIRYQDAGTVVLRGAQLLDEGLSCGYMELEPDYMRIAEAERKLKLRQAQEAGTSR